MIRDHESMRIDYSRNIWCLLVFMLWHEEYVGRPVADAQPSLMACK